MKDIQSLYLEPFVSEEADLTLGKLFWPLKFFKKYLEFSHVKKIWDDGMNTYKIFKISWTIIIQDLIL